MKYAFTHQTAERYTIIVEVKDEGEIQLSGSTTVIVNVEDGNNHFPELIGHTVRNYILQLPQGMKPRFASVFFNTNIFDFFFSFSCQAPGKVTEGVKDVLISRVHVRDNDSKGTAAWKVKYKIHEDTGNFRISTDPETNDGLLYLEKVFIQCAIINESFICDLQESNYSVSKQISLKFDCTAISYSNPSVNLVPSKTI